MIRPAYDWSEELADRLVVLHRDGVSFGNMAAMLGVSKNAVMGKAHRMGLQRDGKPAPIVRYSPKPHVAPPIVSRETKSDPPPHKPADHCCRINDLVDSSCRFPLWMDHMQHPDRYYCGRPSASLVAGRPYCRHHAALCHNH